MIPIVVPDRDKYRKWYLDCDFFMKLEDGHSVLIPKGFRFDGHSVPWFLRWLFPKYHKDDLTAALVHDYLGETVAFHRFDRKWRDEQYTYVMNLYATNEFRKKWMPFGVKWWGYIVTRGWQDYRGEVKPNTQLKVSVTW